MPIAKSCFLHRRVKVGYTTSGSLTQQAILRRVAVFCIKIRVFKETLPAPMFRSFNRKRNPKVATSQMKKKQGIERFRQSAYALNTLFLASRDTASSKIIPFLKVNIACPTFLKGTTVAQTNSLCYRHIERYSIRNGISCATPKKGSLISSWKLAVVYNDRVGPKFHSIHSIHSKV